MFSYGLFVSSGPSGWSIATSGKISGTVGHSLTTDAFRIDEVPFPLEFRIHVQGQGWKKWTSPGDYSSGHGNRLEAIQFRFPNGKPENLALIARVHLQSRGWLSPTLIDNMVILGSTGEKRRLEAIQIALGCGPEFNDYDRIRTRISAIIELNSYLSKLNKFEFPTNVVDKTAAEILIKAGMDRACSEAIVHDVRATMELAACIECPLICAGAVADKVIATGEVINSCAPPPVAPSKSINEHPMDIHNLIETQIDGVDFDGGRFQNVAQALPAVVDV